MMTCSAEWKMNEKYNVECFMSRWTTAYQMTLINALRCLEQRTHDRLLDIRFDCHFSIAILLFFYSTAFAFLETVFGIITATTIPNTNQHNYEMQLTQQYWCCIYYIKAILFDLLMAFWVHASHSIAFQLAPSLALPFSVHFLQHQAH